MEGECCPCAAKDGAALSEGAIDRGRKAARRAALRRTSSAPRRERTDRTGSCCGPGCTDSAATTHRCPARYHCTFSCCTAAGRNLPSSTDYARSNDACADNSTACADPGSDACAHSGSDACAHSGYCADHNNNATPGGHHHTTNDRRPR
jgi:hypothetical protein